MICDKMNLRLWILAFKVMIMDNLLSKTFAIFSIISLNVFLLLFFIQEGHAAIPQKSIRCEACHSLYPGMRDEGNGGGSGGGNRGGGGFIAELGNEVCVDCHSYSGGNSIKVLGDVRVPVVYNYTVPLRPLAGGNFYYLNALPQVAGGHNVDGAAPPDLDMNGRPPGYYGFSDHSFIGYNSIKPLTCAGSNGCHGDRNIENPFDAISGSHHAVDMPIDGSTTARSYRFLKITSITTGVVGLEDGDWGRNSSPLKHNEYTSSIVDFCIECHGLFHVSGNFRGSSPWFRHPAGIVLPDRGEFADYNPDVGALGGGAREYSLKAPIARPYVSSASSDRVYPGIDIITCLSCHMAHGSPYGSILRWDYNAIEAGMDNGFSRTGCLICHAQK